MNPFALLGMAYLAGATPTSHWIGKGWYGVDLREAGSGNLGATNTFRVLGWRAAVPVMIVDVAKGFVPAYWFHRIDGAELSSWALAYGAAAVFGHVFSLWVGFRGGKGVATSTGVLIAVAPGPVLAAFIVWLVVLLSTRIVSAGSVVAALTVPIVAHVRGEQDPLVIGFLWALAIFVVWAHRSNLSRLARGVEPRFRRGSHDESAAEHGKESEIRA